MATSVPAPMANAHVGPGQGRGVVDAVAHHGDLLALLLELASPCASLSWGSTSAITWADAQSVRRMAPAVLLVVAGEHDHVDPQLPEAPLRPDGAGGLGDVGHGHQADSSCPCFVGKVEGGLALVGQLARPRAGKERQRPRPASSIMARLPRHAGAPSHQGGPDAPAVDGGRTRPLR